MQLVDSPTALYKKKFANSVYTAFKNFVDFNDRKKGDKLA
jgi:hypothetical protein